MIGIVKERQDFAADRLGYLCLHHRLELVREGQNQYPLIGTTGPRHSVRTG